MPPWWTSIVWTAASSSRPCWTTTCCSDGRPPLALAAAAEAEVGGADGFAARPTFAPPVRALACSLTAGSTGLTSGPLLISLPAAGGAEDSITPRPSACPAGPVASAASRAASDPPPDAEARARTADGGAGHAGRRPPPPDCGDDRRSRSGPAPVRVQRRLGRLAGPRGIGNPQVHADLPGEHPARGRARPERPPVLHRLGRRMDRDVRPCRWVRPGPAHPSGGRPGRTRLRRRRVSVGWSVPVAVGPSVCASQRLYRWTSSPPASPTGRRERRRNDDGLAIWLRAVTRPSTEGRAHRSRLSSQPDPLSVRPGNEHL